MAILADSKPVSYLQAHIDELLTQINATHQPVAITENGETKAILQDPESHQSLQNAISLLKLIAQAEEDISLGRMLGQADVFKEVEDYCLAAEILERVRKGQEQIHSATDVRKDLGLDD
ncbi:MAG: type II toxin-antitoxin system Phd/YefM family antitoxin [Methylococcaceae bacterium]|nr:type II toxin-antitoxin system Phd/YefM family antitoxin [Methylococcaceae bacterium]